ncbi:MAG: biotin transporter BioY [Clostridia bacterium]|nr:biotin transporter BioY [Clostridia bacterium]
MKRQRRMYELTLTAIVTALLSVSSLIYLPLTVPITLQTLLLFTSLFTLGGKITTVATGLYIIIGGIGLPVFSGFSGGVGRLFDATGGFIFGLLLASLLYWLLTSLTKTEWAALPFAVACHLLLYAVGTLWYALIYLSGEGSVFSALAVTVLPFLFPDALKLTVAYILSQRLKKIIDRTVS